MYSSAAIFSLLALAGQSFSAPLQLPADANVQLQILYTEQSIVNLINDFVQANPTAAKNDYNTANNNLYSLGFTLDQSNGSPCSFSLNGRPDTEASAAQFLNYTQTALMDLSLALQDPSSSQGLLQNKFCEAYNNFRLTEYYATSVIGTPSNGASNIPPSTTVSATSPLGYDPTKLDSTYQSSLIALESLINFLNIPATATSQGAKDAFNKAQLALASYKTAANPQSEALCAPGMPAPATDAAGAIARVKTVEDTVQSAYADTRAANGKNFQDFCVIANYMSSVNAFVKA